MFDQRCPHCGGRLGRKKLANLDPRRPSVCPKCGHLVYNTWRGLLLGLATGVLTLIAFLLVAGPVLKGYLIFALVPFVPVVGFWALAAWAEPRVIESQHQVCEVCHREDVGY